MTMDTAENTVEFPEHIASRKQLEVAAFDIVQLEGHRALTRARLAKHLGLDNADRIALLDMASLEVAAGDYLVQELDFPPFYDNSGLTLRERLLDFLMLARWVAQLHPAAMFPPAGSPAEETLFEILSAWDWMLAEAAGDFLSARRALDALLAFVILGQRRSEIFDRGRNVRRLCINVHAQDTQKDFDPNDLEEDYEMVLNDLNNLIDILLPNLSD